MLTKFKYKSIRKTLRVCLNRNPDIKRKDLGFVQVAGIRTNNIVEMFCFENIQHFITKLILF